MGSTLKECAERLLTLDVEDEHRELDYWLSEVLCHIKDLRERGDTRLERALQIRIERVEDIIRRKSECAKNP